MREPAGRRIGRARVAFLAITAMIMALAGVGLAGSAAAASTLVVDDDSACPGAAYTTITAAVAAAASGDHIQVCAGTYNENVDDLGKNLLFLGPENAVDPRSADYPRAAGEAVVDGGGNTAFTLGFGSGVAGFTIRDVQAVGQPAIKTTDDDNSFVNNVFTDDTLGLDIGGLSDTVSQNLFDTTSVGIRIGGAVGDDTVISANLFTDSVADAAITIGGLGPHSVRIAIQGNSYFGGGAFLSATRTDDLFVGGNTIVGTGAVQSAIVFAGGVNGFTISENVISGYAEAAVRIFDAFSSPTNGPGVINSNRFQGNRRGIDLEQRDGGPIATVDVHFNTLTGNNTGPNAPTSPNAAIRNLGGGTVNAENNFFGCNTGPNTSGCDAVLGAATTDPFLVLSSTIGTKTLTSAQTTTFTADLNHDNHGALVSTPVLDGLGITFSASGGLSVFPASAVLTAGTASTTVKPKPNGGVGWTGQKVSGRVVNATTSQSGITVKPSPPALTVHDASTTEGTSGTHVLNFPVTLSHKYDKAVTVKYATANGTAKAGADYLAKTGTLTFPAGVTSKPIAITIKGDKVKEGNETFAVTIFSPVNATVGDPNAIGVIRNS